MSVLPTLVRTPEQLKTARQILALSAEGLAAMVRMGDGRTVRRWESGESEIPGPVIVILETAMDFLRQRDEIARQLEMLETGKMRFSWGATLKDTPPDNITRHSEAKNSLEHALAILTRQPPNGGVHWYALERLTPKHDPAEKDRWTLPGETSSEAALAYFEKEARFTCRLELCGDDELSAEFRLEKRMALRDEVGATRRVRQGDLVETFLVKRA